MSIKNLKKFINKYQDVEKLIAAPKWTETSDDAAWKQGADDLMAALRINIEDLEKFNDLDD
ncbi:MAG: hypothetical protein H8E12_17045 [Rhodobacteraceae bacterium]|nr:hypothetical protein [Paracoccaceae bacterium]